MEENEELNIIDLAKLAEELNLKKEEKVLGNGRVVSSINWQKESFKLAVNHVKSLSKEGKKVLITGQGPAWLLTRIITCSSSMPSYCICSSNRKKCRYRITSEEEM